MTGEPTTVTELLLARARDHHDGLLFEERSWSWAEHVVCSARYAAALRAVHKPGTPCHIGLLADNVPEFSFLLGGCAFSGAVLVGLNPVRRGAALARDIRLADCRLVIAERTYLPLLRGLDLGGAEVLELGSSGWHDFLAAGEAYAGDPVPAAPDDLLMLIFTSGTSGDPKAVRCTHAKVTMPGIMLSERFDLSTADTAYVAMPMFHSNAIMAGWSVGLAAGATLALRRRFSASGFLPDIRRYDATYANYVGKPLSYVLATEVLPDDADNPLRIMYGNEGSSADLRRFAERFGCHVVDGFGSSEGGIAITRTPDTPHAALGPLPPDVRILSEDSGLLCPPALLDEHGGLCNGNEAIGELVNVSGAGAFAGYYKNEDADRARLRGG
ncbi:MAG: AMP-binding protein, partial [Sciscionella sp.]